MRKPFIIFALFILAAALPAQQQMLSSVEALSDFYAIYGVMSSGGKPLLKAADMKGHITDVVKQKLQSGVPYRAAFIGQVTAMASFNSGQSSMANSGETINALTGFLLLVEGNGDIETWTVKEVSQKYDRLLQTAWQNTNPTLFILMLQNYCAWKRGELGW
jgi:hypothetical protein